MEGSHTFQGSWTVQITTLLSIFWFMENLTWKTTHLELDLMCSAIVTLCSYLNMITLISYPKHNNYTFVLNAKHLSHTLQISNITYFIYTDLNHINSSLLILLNDKTGNSPLVGVPLLHVPVWAMATQWCGHKSPGPYLFSILPYYYRANTTGVIWYCYTTYRQVSNIRSTLVGN